MQVKKAAKKIEKMGRKGDTILAHINEEEAGLLKAMGGSGKRNPKTGLLSFDPSGPEGETAGGPGGSDPGSERTGDYGPGMSNEVGQLSRGDNFGTAATEVRGFTPGVDMQNRNFFGQMLDRFNGLSQGQQLGLGMAAPGVGGLGMFGNYLDRNFGLGWSGGSTGGGTGGPAMGNGFDGGNLPNDGATTPVVPTTGTGGTGGTTTGLPITPPNWGNYGPSPFTYKFGQPRNMDGLLNFGGQTSAQPATQPAAQSSMTNNAIRAMTPQSANWGASMPTGTSMQATNPVPNQYLPGSGLLGAGTISRQGRVADDPYSTTTTSDMMGGRRPSGSFADIFRSMRGA